MPAWPSLLRGQGKAFLGRNALGERIRIDGLSVEVVGILSPEMQGGDGGQPRGLRPVYDHEWSQGYALPRLHLVEVLDSCL